MPLESVLEHRADDPASLAHVPGILEEIRPLIREPHPEARSFGRPPQGVDFSMNTCGGVAFGDEVLFQRVLDA